MPSRPLHIWALAYAWIPAMLGVAVIICESTSQFSSANTTVPLRHLWEAIFGPVGNEAWILIHKHIRKTGHAVGYGLLSGLFFRAWLLTLNLFNKAKQALLPSTVLALVSTLIIASADEMHQKFVPGRTSSAVDVSIDMGGALLVQAIILVYFLSRSNSRQPAKIESTQTNRK